MSEIEKPIGPKEADELEKGMEITLKKYEDTKQGKIQRDLLGLPSDHQIVRYSLVLTRMNGALKDQMQIGMDIKTMQAGIQIGGLYVRDLALELMPKWISVEDQMPPRAQHVLAFTTEECVLIAEYDDGEWEGDLYENETITHWMKVPDGPKPQKK